MRANYAINPTPEQALGSNRAVLPARVIAALDFFANLGRLWEGRMSQISQRFFRQDPGSDKLIPVDFIIGELESYEYEGLTKWRLRMQLQGILPEESEITRHQSSLQALIAGFEKVRVFFADFTKAGGKLYPCRFDSQDTPWMEDGAVRIKYFLRPE